MDVCVLGAGIVGLSTAYALSQHGFSVTVVDASSVGAGASAGNGAQLSYSYVQPLADPSIWAQLPKLLLSPNSPLKIRPQLDPQQWRWGVEFLRACNAQTSAATTASLLILAAQSKSAFDTMLQKEKFDCDYSQTGKLVLYPDAVSFAAAQRQVDLQHLLGSEQEAVSAARACEIEPALGGYRGAVAGAVHTASEAAVDCLTLCQGLECLLRQRGVRFVLNTPINALQLDAGRISAAHTAAGLVEAKYFVLALGAGSTALARTAGLRLPVYPIKGYSITLDLSDAVDAAPTVNVTDIARKLVFARIGSRLRVAGMAELVGHDRSVSATAVSRLQRSTEELFPALAGCASTLPWAGLRPATPTGLPIEGVQVGGPANLLVNTGHGALGLTLAFGTAQRLASALLVIAKN
jgi:D-amino-acid dehydrogenase